MLNEYHPFAWLMAGWEQRGAPGAHGGPRPGDPLQAQGREGARGALRPPSAMPHERSHLPWGTQELPAPGDGTGPGLCSAGPPSLGHPRRPGSCAQGARGCQVRARNTTARCLCTCKCRTQQNYLFAKFTYLPKGRICLHKRLLLPMATYCPVWPLVLKVLISS